MTLSDFLHRLKSPTRTGQGYIAFCPAHKDQNNKSLSVSQGDKGIVLNCFAGCSTAAVVEAMGLKLNDLFESERRGSSAIKTRKGSGGPSPAAAPLTLAQLAAAKKLPPSFLYDLGVEDHPDHLGVLIGYFDVNGQQHARHRLRTALSAKEGSKWWPGESKAPAGLYGEWRLPK